MRSRACRHCINGMCRWVPGQPPRALTRAGRVVWSAALVVIGFAVRYLYLHPAPPTRIEARVITQLAAYVTRHPQTMDVTMDRDNIVVHSTDGASAECVGSRCTLHSRARSRPLQLSDLFAIQQLLACETIPQSLRGLNDDRTILDEADHPLARYDSGLVALCFTTWDSNSMTGYVYWVRGPKPEISDSPIVISSDEIVPLGNRLYYGHDFKGEQPNWVQPPAFTKSAAASGHAGN